MSNKLYLEPTSFTDLRTTDVSIGYRIYDDIAKTYCNIMNLNDPSYRIPDDDLEFLKDAMEFLNEDEISREMISDLKDGGKGMYIGGTWYPLNKLEEIL